MPVPASQMWTVATYVVKQKLKGRKRYPLVLMLEPLYRCNLACAGCGKIQYPGHILKRELTPEECFRAVDECGVPTVAIPGGEPLMHPRIDEIVRGLVARKKYVYMCTNALLLKEKLHLFTPCLLYTSPLGTYGFLLLRSRSLHAELDSGLPRRSSRSRVGQTRLISATVSDGCRSTT